MAAGRYGERNSNHALPQRTVAYPNDRDDDNRTGSRRNEGDFRDRSRDTGRVRQKDIKDRDSLNGDIRSSSRSGSGVSGGGVNGGPRRCGNSVRIVDREPGELSSESGSDGAVESESQVKDIVASKMENGTQSSPITRKRKFSPIVWDRDDQVKGLSKGTKASSTSCTALPPLPKTDRLSSNSITNPSNNLHVPPVTTNPETSLSRGYEEHEAINNTALEEVQGDVHDQSYEQGLGNIEEGERLEEENYVATRNISSSRWAGDADSPNDEGETFGDEDLFSGRKALAAKSRDTGLSKRSTSPEGMEFKKEIFDIAKMRTSNVEGVHIRPSSGDQGSENDFVAGDDIMEVDGEKNNNRSSYSSADMDSEERIIYHETPEPPVPPQRTVNMLQGCRSVDEFERLNKIDEGTYGVVYRARDRKTGEVVALKKVKMEKEREGFPMTSLREINILLSFHHPSIVDVKEVVVGSSLDSIFMVMEYMEHDLKALMETMKQPFSQSEVKCLMLQLLEGIHYLHDNWVLHRDLKTSNLLLNNRGELKICDFGLARQYGSPLKPYTRLVVTLWYRAPELLLGAKQYSTAIDMWSLGCIMAELLSKEPLFNGKAEFDQLDKVHSCHKRQSTR